MNLNYTLGIIVAYNKPKFAVAAANALLNQINVLVKVVIIDNSEISNIDSTVLEKQDDLIVHFTNANLGYAKGNNLGLEIATKNWGSPSYLLICNDDVVINNNEIVSELIAAESYLPDCGCIQPKIHLSNGFLQGPYERASIYIEMLQYLIPIFWIYNRSQKQKKLRSFESLHKSFRVMGAFFLIKTKKFCDAGMFKPSTFLGSEEEILAHSLSKFGFVSYCLYTVDVLHMQDPKSGRINEFFHASMLDLYKDCYKVNGLSLKLYDFSYRFFSFIYKPLINRVYCIARILRCK